MAMFFVVVGIILDHGRDVLQDRNAASSTTFGFLVDVGAKINLSQKFFLALDVQYRHVGNGDIGPFVVKDVVGWANPIPSVMYITFPKTSVNFDHWLIGLGMGMNF